MEAFRPRPRIDATAIHRPVPSFQTICLFGQVPLNGGQRVFLHPLAACCVSQPTNRLDLGNHFGGKRWKTKSRRSETDRL